MKIISYITVFIVGMYLAGKFVLAKISDEITKHFPELLDSDNYYE